MTKNILNSEAEKILHEYRPTMWRKTVLENVLGIDSKEFISCLKKLNFVEDLAETLHSHKLLGKKLYWIIHFTYMTENVPCNKEEIFINIANKCGHIPRSSYFRLKARAIDLLDNQLKIISKITSSVQM